MLFEPAIIAALVTLLIGGGITVLRYLFDIQLITGPEVDEKMVEANTRHQEEFNRISDTLDEHNQKLDEIEDLIMGSEYQVNDGMLEIVEMNREDVEEHESRIEGVERVQLKIRRRQKEHNGGEPVAHGEDLDPPPRMNPEDKENT